MIFENSGDARESLKKKFKCIRKEHHNSLYVSPRRWKTM